MCQKKLQDDKLFESDYMIISHLIRAVCTMYYMYKNVWSMMNFDWMYFVINLISENIVFDGNLT